MNKKLDDLSGGFKSKAMELLARCVEAGIPIAIINTWRTKEEQEELIRKGVSWTMNSKHLIGRAIDIAPLSVLSLKNWAPNHPDWKRMGEIGHKLGLKWGGDWVQRDMGHFEG